MKISYEWLKEYVDVKFSPEELAGELTMLGFEASSEGMVGKHHVIDVEVTSNRPDCLSVLGLAREISALTAKQLRFPEITLNENGGDAGNSISVEVNSKLCSRYCARLITDVNVEPSPASLKEKLEGVGIRSVNNVVDITNYVLMEMGHPLHAFDREKLRGRKIIVRCAEQGEKIMTIDGVERILQPSMLIIADEEKPAAIAGIMGGSRSEVTEGTKTILLESACFDPFSVRKTSKKLQLETESSYRFQRKADIESTIPAIDRAARLIQEIAGGKIAKGVIDYFPEKAEKRKVCLRLSRLNQILGVKLSSDTVEKKLDSLGFEVRRQDSEFAISVPSFRRDIEREIDLIEEAARLYGYDRIQSTIPAGRIPPGSEDRLTKLAKTACTVLTGGGLTEVINHGLVSEKWVRNFAYPVIKVMNPLSEEQSILRPTLIPGLLKTLSVNITRGVKNVRIFELGNVYEPGDRERLSIGAAITGSNADFYDLKGVMENLFAGLGISGSLAPYNGRFLVSGESAKVNIGKCELGVIGKVCDELRGEFDIDETYIFELNFLNLANHARVDVRFTPLPRYPASFRDIAVVVNEDIRCADLMFVIMDEGKGTVEKAELFDIYRGEQIAEGCKSMAFSITYRLNDRTLKDNEVNELHERISKKLASQFNGYIRKE
jgi:phenylalanyl-tRNA synthetase beta chain